MSENDANPIVRLPLVCTRGVIVFPNQEVIIDVGREQIYVCCRRGSGKV